MSRICCLLDYRPVFSSFGLHFRCAFDCFHGLLGVQAQNGACMLFYVHGPAVMTLHAAHSRPPCNGWPLLHVRKSSTLTDADLGGLGMKILR